MPVMQHMGNALRLLLEQLQSFLQRSRRASWLRHPWLMHAWTPDVDALHCGGSVAFEVRKEHL